jgi:EcsC protein family
MKSLSKALGAVRGWTDDRAGHGAMVAVLRQGFDWAYGKAVDGLPGLDGAEALAVRYGGRHADTDAAVAALIAWQTGIAGAAGFVTGCGGFVALPVAMPANLASALYIQARLIGAIAHMRGHDIRSDEARMLALVCLTGSKAADTLKDAGVRFGTRLTRDAVGWASPALFKKLEHAAGVSATAAAAGNLAKLGKFVPVVGGVVAGGFDAAMTQLIGRTADRVFRGRAPADPAV